MLNKILRYHSIIILLYEFLILLIFWLITGFIFENNNSLILIFLMIVPPLVLYIFYYIKRKKNSIKFNDYHSSYFSVIKKDIKTTKIDDLLIKPLKEYLSDLVYKVTDKQIYLNGGKNNKITIMIEENLATLLIDNTKIIYQYIYDYKGIDVTKYDFKGLKRYPTTKLYELIINQVKQLVNQNLTYTEYFQGKYMSGCKLEGKEVIYLIKGTQKGFLKRKSEKNKTIFI